MRIVTGATARSNINNLYIETGWVPLKNRRLIHALTMLYKVINGQANDYLVAQLPQTVNNRANRSLRSGKNLDIPFARLECFRRSFFPFSIRQWNLLPDNIKSSPDLNSFKLSLAKKYKTESKNPFNNSKWAIFFHYWGDNY